MEGGNCCCHISGGEDDEPTMMKGIIGRKGKRVQGGGQKETFKAAAGAKAD